MYEVGGGVIRTKGQFEGQAIYVPHFWGVYLAGDADEVGRDIIQFVVKANDRVQFPELGNRQVIRIRPNGIKIEEA
jgi:hypothetical protein